MRALLSTLAVALLLYGTSLFSRDRERPPWAHSAVDRSGPQEQSAPRFENLSALLHSLEPVATGSVRAHEVQQDTPAVAQPNATASAAASAAEKRPTLKRDDPAKWRPQPRRTPRLSQVATREQLIEEPSAATTAHIRADPIEYSLADRGN